MRSFNRFILDVTVALGLALLIMGINVANLILARMLARRKEVAIRMALGATRGQVMRSLLAEPILLSLLGGAGGLLVAHWSSRLPLRFASFEGARLDLDLGADARVFGLSVVFSLLLGLILGLASSFQASKVDILPRLNSETAATCSKNTRFGIRNLLVIAQLSLSLVLVSLGSLMIQTERSFLAVDLGFEPKNILFMSLGPSRRVESDQKGRQFYRQLFERVRALPGVVSVSSTANIPIGMGSMVSSFRIYGYPQRRGENLVAAYHIVGPGYMQTMGIPVIHGRDFADEDDERSAWVVIANETMARRFWPGTSPIGQRILVSGAGPEYLKVIGVVKDSKYLTMGEEPEQYKLSLYLPLFQHYQSEMTLLVRAMRNPSSLTPFIKLAVLNLEQDTRILEVGTLTEHLASWLRPTQVLANLLAVSALVALCLAVFGLYGLMAYFVVLRRRELGIRLALGAKPKDLLRLVLIDGLRLTIPGMITGLVATPFFARLISHWLFGVSAFDPKTFLGVPVLLVGAGVAASYLPARQASEVDPLVALRSE